VINKPFILLTFSFFLFPLVSLAAGFDGVHIYNKDGRDYILKYKEWRLTTAVCEIKRPTKTIKRGLVSAFQRSPVKGFEILSSKNSEALGGAEKEITARISAHTDVLCVCVRDCRIEVENVPAVEAKSGQTLIIKDGRVFTPAVSTNPGPAPSRAGRSL
jgi:hypothetical protein